jgi:hypothetical protein
VILIQEDWNWFVNGCVDVGNRVLFQDYEGAYPFRDWVARVAQGDWSRILMGWVVRGVHREGPEVEVFATVGPVLAEGLVAIERVDFDMIAVVHRKEAVGIVGESWNSQVEEGAAAGIVDRMLAAGDMNLL